MSKTPKDVDAIVDVSYIAENGYPPPKGYHLHHRCSNKLCINTAHLEVVTPREHLVECSANAQAYINARKENCLRGHPLDKNRSCKVCKCDAVKRYYKRNRLSILQKLKAKKANG